MGKKIFEVEVRGLLDKEQYEKLIKYLDKNADRKEKDDRITDFFEIPDATLKVANCKDLKSAKIAFKKGDIISSLAQEEVEFSIHPEQTKDMVKLFTKLLAHLGHSIVYHSEQNRINYWIDGYEFAVKWSENYGYHYEVELLINDESEIVNTRNKIIEYVKSLDLPIMTQEEFTELADKARALICNKETL